MEAIAELKRTANHLADCTYRVETLWGRGERDDSVTFLEDIIARTATLQQQARDLLDIVRTAATERCRSAAAPRGA